jgi:serine/threonine-protein kinase RsbT
MDVLKRETLPILAEVDLVHVRRAVKTWSTELRFSTLDQTKMVTAASELSRNTLVYGGGGNAVLELLEDGGRRGLRLTFEDHGPGIADIELAMTDGFTTGRGMGLGLSGSKRLVNEFEIFSQPGEGTRVSVTRWK